MHKDDIVRAGEVDERFPEQGDGQRSARIRAPGERRQGVPAQPELTAEDTFQLLCRLRDLAVDVGQIIAVEAYTDETGERLLTTLDAALAVAVLKRKPDIA